MKKNRKEGKVKKYSPLFGLCAGGGGGGGVLLGGWVVEEEE